MIRKLEQAEKLLSEAAKNFYKIDEGISDWITAIQADLFHCILTAQSKTKDEAIFICADCGKRVCQKSNSEELCEDCLTTRELDNNELTELIETDLPECCGCCGCKEDDDNMLFECVRCGDYTCDNCHKDRVCSECWSEKRAEEEFWGSKL